MYIAIVEDDIVMAEKLLAHNRAFFDANGIEIKIEIFTNAFDFIESFEGQFDLIYMDIALPNMNGIEASEKIRKLDMNVMIVFVTSLNQYALEGYKVNAFDFLIKPISYHDLCLTLNRALPYFQNKGLSLTIKTNKRVIVKIFYSDIKYIEVNHHMLTFYTRDSVYECYGQLKNYIDLLESKFFSLCHQSFLVNLKYVDIVDHNDVVIGNKKIPISRPRRKKFLSDLNLYLSAGRGE